MSSIRLERLTFAFHDAVPVLDEVSLQLGEGWTGLVGENGAGKTTLLRLIHGTLAPVAGGLRIRPEAATVVLCPQEVEEPGVDVVTLGERDDGEARRLRGSLRIEPDHLARWATLSPGERKRWQVGAALARAPEVLLLDEPTNHVDAEARGLLLGALRRFSGVGLLVSHDRGLLETLCAQTLRLHHGEARLFPGAYGAARALWEAEAGAARGRRAMAQQDARRAAAKLADARRVRESAERAMSGRNRDIKDHDSRTLGAKTRRAWAENRLGSDVKRLRAAAGRAEQAIPEAPVASELGRSVFVNFERARRPVLLSLDAAEVRAGDRVVLRDVHVRLGRDDRVRLAGRNGAGKSTLIKALTAGSTLPPDKLLVLPQELPSEAAAAMIDEVRGLTSDVRGRVFSLVAALGTDPDRLLASARPSPGEARKLQLALGLGRHAWALVLDEPANHLDLPTVERLEEALAQYPGAILLVTHDDALAARCTTRAWQLTRGRIEAM